MEKLSEKILSLKYQVHLIKKALLEADSKLKKSDPELLEPESDLDEDTIVRKEKEYEEEEKEKLEKRYEKMCEKAKANDEEKPEKPELVLDKLNGLSVDKLMKKLESTNAKINQAKNMRIDRVSVSSRIVPYYTRMKTKLLPWVHLKLIILILG
jgi:DNA topoisomerase I